MQSATVNQIYNYLFDGKKVKLEFPTAGELATFRTALHRFKKVQDDALMAVDIIEEPQVLKVDITPMLFDRLPSTRVLAVLYFQERSLAKKYQIEIIEEEDQCDGGS